MAPTSLSLILTIFSLSSSLSPSIGAVCAPLSAPYNALLREYLPPAGSAHSPAPSPSPLTAPSAKSSSPQSAKSPSSATASSPAMPKSSPPSSSPTPKSSPSPQSAKPPSSSSSSTPKSAPSPSQSAKSSLSPSSPTPKYASSPSSPTKSTPPPPSSSPTPKSAPSPQSTKPPSSAASSPTAKSAESPQYGKSPTSAPPPSKNPQPPTSSSSSSPTNDKDSENNSGSQATDKMIKTKTTGDSDHGDKPETPAKVLDGSLKAICDDLPDPDLCMTALPAASEDDIKSIDLLGALELAINAILIDSRDARDKARSVSTSDDYYDPVNLCNRTMGSALRQSKEALLSLENKDFLIYSTMDVISHSIGVCQEGDPSPLTPDMDRLRKLHEIACYLLWKLEPRNIPAHLVGLV